MKNFLSHKLNCVYVCACGHMCNCIAVDTEYLESLGLGSIVKSHYLLVLALLQYHTNLAVFLKFQTYFLFSLPLKVQLLPGLTYQFSSDG